VATGSQNGYLSSTDWTTFNGKQNALTLTTTGSSGSATLVGATLNVPTYTLSGLGGVPTSRQLTINGTAYDLSADRSWSVGTHTGSLTSGYVPKATGTTSLADSLVYDAGTAVLIGTTTASTSKFMVYSTTADNHYQAIGSAPSFRFADTITSPNYTGIIGLATASNNFIIGAVAGDMVLANNTTSSLGNFLFGTGTTERMRITPTGNVSINNTNNTYRFDVNGTVRFTGQLRLESTITNGTYTYTLPSATGTIALTSDIPSGAITGSGTTNYLPKFTGTSTIGNSVIQEASSLIGIGMTPVSGYKLNVSGLQRNEGANTVLNFGELDANNIYFQALNLAGNASKGFVWFGTSEYMRLNASGNLSIGNTNDTYKLDVSGTGRFTGVVTSDSNFRANGGTYQQFRFGAFRGGLYTYDGASGSGTDYSPTLFSETELYFCTGGSITKKLTIASTGAATFSDEVRAGSWVATANSRGFTIRNAANTAYRTAVQMNSSNVLIFGQDTDISALTLGVGSEQMRITSGGNVGIGTTSPSDKLQVVGSLRWAGATNNIVSSNDAGGVYMELNGTSTATRILRIQGINDAANRYSSIKLRAGEEVISFETADVERMRITSGGTLLVGTTTTGNNERFNVTQSGANWAQAINHTNSTQFFIDFRNSGTQTGSIIGSGGVTSYNTTSDYRLKEDLKSIKGLEKLSAIKVYDFKWKNNDYRMDGVLAHELQQVLPYAVFGVKDGEQMQQVDYSKIVPVMVQAIKELKVELDTLKNK
jgi:hypothetical protein